MFQRKTFLWLVIRANHSNQFTIHVSVTIVYIFCHGYVKKRILIYFFDKMFNLKSGFLASSWQDYLETVFFFLYPSNKENLYPPHYMNVCFGVITAFRVFFMQKLKAM